MNFLRVATDRLLNLDLVRNIQFVRREAGPVVAGAPTKLRDAVMFEYSDGEPIYIYDDDALTLIPILERLAEHREAVGLDADRYPAESPQ